MGSNEEDKPHYNYDSDGEPPVDQVGDKLTVVKKQQVVKTILEVGENNCGKPGRPYIVKVTLKAYFAKEESFQANEVTKEVTDTHVRIPADELNDVGEVFIDYPQPIQFTLGDDRLPHGLWKSIEHMRKGEKARIMCKPKWAYNYEKNRDTVIIPKGWEDKVDTLRKRRVFFEV